VSKESKTPVVYAGTLDNLSEAKHLMDDRDLIVMSFDASAIPPAKIAEAISQIETKARGRVCLCPITFAEDGASSPEWSDPALLMWVGRFVQDHSDLLPLLYDEELLRQKKAELADVPFLGRIRVLALGGYGSVSLSGNRAFFGLTLEGCAILKGIREGGNFS